MTIAAARRIVRAANRIVAFSGAGLSAESGVPTFRDAATGGLWSKYDPMTLASPEGFAADPDLVVRWYLDRRRGVDRAEPNPAHRALAAHPEIVNVTQNVDDLLQRAGAERVIQLHGTLTRDRCHGACGYEAVADPANPSPLRSCPECGARMRPAVVWFGEALPAKAWHEAEAVCNDCDVMLVVGTSAAVYPAASLIGCAQARGATIIVVNTQAGEAGGVEDVELLGPAGEILPALLAD